MSGPVQCSAGSNVVPCKCTCRATKDKPSQIYYKAQAKAAHTLEKTRKLSVNKIRHVANVSTNPSTFRRTATIASASKGLTQLRDACRKFSSINR